MSTKLHTLRVTFLGVNWTGRIANNSLHPLQRFKMNGAILLLSLYVFTGWTGVNCLALILFKEFSHYQLHILCLSVCLSVSQKRLKTKLKKFGINKMAP